MKEKKANPFGWNPEGAKVFGRKFETELFISFMNATTTGQPGVMTVNGCLGSGKTTLLKYFRHEIVRSGLTCIYVKVEKGEKEEDIINKAFYDMKHIEDVVDYLGKHGRETIIIMDDIDKLRDSDAVVTRVVEKVNSSWGKKVSVIMGSTRELDIDQENIKKISLKRFDEHDIGELIDGTIGKEEPKVGKEFIHSLLEESSGNQKAIVLVLWYMYEKLGDKEKVITKGHYLNYLPQAMELLANEWFGRVYNEIPNAERDVLKVLAREFEGMKISEIAKKLRKPLGPVSALVRRLVDGGQVVKVERGHYRIFCMLYGKYVLQRN